MTLIDAILDFFAVIRDFFATKFTDLPTAARNVLLVFFAVWITHAALCAFFRKDSKEEDKNRKTTAPNLNGTIRSLAFMIQIIQYLFPALYVIGAKEILDEMGFVNGEIHNQQYAIEVLFHKLSSGLLYYAIIISLANISLKAWPTSTSHEDRPIPNPPIHPEALQAAVSTLTESADSMVEAAKQVAEAFASQKRILEDIEAAIDRLSSRSSQARNKRGPARNGGQNVVPMREPPR